MDQDTQHFKNLYDAALDVIVDMIGELYVFGPDTRWDND